MPGAVDEEFAESGGDEMVACHSVDALAGHPGAHSSACVALRLLQRGVGTEIFLAGIAQGVSPGLVAAVSVWHGPPDVDHDGIARREDPIGDLVMRAGAVGAGRHDDEVDAHMACLQDQRCDVLTHLALRASDAQQ